MKIYKLIILVCFFFFSCAVQSKPPGGAIDNNSPLIVELIPPNNSTSIHSKQSITIIFNEMIDQNTIRSSFSIYPKTQIKISTKRNIIEIQPVENWPDGSFKIIGSRNIMDYNYNNLDNCIEINYSTSNIIPTGFIEGNIYNIESHEVCEVALLEKDYFSDNLKIQSIVQNNNTGYFKFENVENGTYYLFASTKPITNIYDDIRNFDYSVGSDKIFISNDSSFYNNIYIYEAAKRLQLKSFNKINKNYGNIILNNGDVINVISQTDIFDTIIPNDSTYIKINYSELDDSISINVPLLNNQEAYNVIGSLKIEHAIIDTTGPSITENHRMNNIVNLKFSEPIILNLLDENDVIFNPKLKYKYLSPNNILIYNLADTLKKIDFAKENIKDLANNSLLDSSIIIRNKTDEAFDIEGGSILGEIKYFGKEDLVVTMNSKNENIKYEMITTNNSFYFNNVVPDIYYIWAYENISGYSDSYYNGILRPLKLSAKFAVYPNSIEIRKKWDIEGIILEIK